jgi:excisionase family DNA binding protein
MSLPRVMTPKMLAELWHVSERHVRNLISAGDLPSFRVGGKLLRIRGADVEVFECQASQDGDLPDSESSLPSPSKTKPENVIGFHSEPLTRAKLSALRRPSTRS